MFQNSSHVLNFDCGFTHMSRIWPDGKINGGLNGTCCKMIAATTIELWIILNVQYVRVLTKKLPTWLVWALLFSI